MISWILSLTDNDRDSLDHNGHCNSRFKRLLKVNIPDEVVRETNASTGLSFKGSEWLVT